MGQRGIEPLHPMDVAGGALLAICRQVATNVSPGVARHYGVTQE